MNIRTVGLSAFCLVVLGWAPATAGASPSAPRSYRSSAAAHCTVVVKKVRGHRTKVRHCRHHHTAPLFASPSDLALNAAGNVLIADQKSHSIITLSPRGKVLARWKQAGSKPASFELLYGIALDGKGNVYVSDATGQVLDKLGPDGHPLAQWNTNALQAGSFPTLLAIATNGDVYLADHGAEAVLHLSPSGALIGKIGAGTLGDPYGVTIGPDGNIYVADFGAGRVREFTPDGAPVATWGDKAGLVQLQNPEAIIVDPHGNIYVSEQAGEIVKFDRAGTVLARWQSRGALSLSDPSGLALDPHGNIYVAEYMGNRVDKLSPTGRVLAVWH